MSDFLNKPVGEMTKAELTRLVQQVVSRMVPAIPSGVQELNDLDVPIALPPAILNGQVLTYDGALGTVVPTDANDIAVATDGTPPGSSPTPSAKGGSRYFAVKWAAVANVDPVTYEVHVSATTGFTPSVLTKAGETPGLLAFIKTLPDGTDFSYNTDYFFKIIAKDSDSSAGASAQSAAAQLDPNGRDDILAGEITAEKLESVLNMATSFMAGAFGGANVQVGFGVKDDGSGNPIVDTTFIGVRSYDGSSSDPVFKLPADGSPAQFRGTVKFGSSACSKLLPNDMMQLQEQPGGAFATPTLIQSNGWNNDTASSVSVEFESDVTVGNLILAVCTHWKGAGAGSFTPPGGWTTLHNFTWGDASSCRTFIMAKIATGTGDGSPGDPITGTIGVTADVITFQCFEFYGATVTEHVASRSAESTTNGAQTINTGNVTAITTQSLVLGFGMCQGTDIYRGAPSYASIKPTTYPVDKPLIGQAHANDFVFGLNGGHAVETNVFSKVAASGTPNMAADTNADCLSGAMAIVVLEAAANTVESADSDSARLYAQDIGGVAYLHSQDQNGRESAVALGKAGEVWRLDYMTGAKDLPNIVANTALTDTVSVSGVAVGDIVVFLEKYPTLNRSLIIRAEPLVTVADTIELHIFNADTADLNPASTSFHFLVIHRT